MKLRIVASTLLITALVGCSTAYYGAMEKVGIHKRDIMVDRVESARDSQKDAQEEFKDALEQFGSVVALKETDLKKAYDKLNGEYEDSLAAAEKVSDRIDSVESVAEDLFKEWKQEIAQYQNASYRSTSQKQLNATKARYRDMLATMKKAEASMQPVLNNFRDNVLFLKHNLNAQAIGSLRSEFSTLSNDIDRLISTMNRSIASSNDFIANMNSQ